MPKLGGEIHVISNGKLTLQEFAEKAAEISQYVDYFHLREKLLTARELMEGVQLLLDGGVSPEKVIINDRVDVAVAAGVSGVQLAYHSLSVAQVKTHFPSLRVGCSVHSLEEAIAAYEAGADHVLYGHIFSTQSKPGLAPRGVDGLKELVDSVEIPLVAIGGIKPTNAPEVWAAGAKGIAIMSGVLEAENPLEVMKAYVDKKGVEA